MSLRRSLALLAVVLGVLALTAGPTQAEPRGRIESIQTASDGTLKVVFSGVDLAGAALDPAKVTVTVDGHPLEASASPITTTTTPVQRTAVLAVDTSGSMAGTGIAAAKQAALTFLEVVPADVRVGLVTFADTARVVQPPTTDRVGLRRAVSALSPKGDTALYDAVALSLRTVGAAGVRSVLLLTDGADDGSRATLTQAVATVKAARVGLDAVALQTDATVTGPLQQLVSAAKGRVVASTQASVLAAAFRAAAQAIADQVFVTAKVAPAQAGKAATVAVTIGTSAGQVTDSTFVTIPAVATAAPTAGPRAVDVDDGALTSDAALWIGLAALFAGLVLLLAFALLRANPDRPATRMRRRLSIYTLTGRAQQEHSETSTTTALGDSSVARSAVEFADRVMEKRNLEAALGRKLDAAGIPLRPAEWLVIHAGIAFGAMLLGLLLGGGRALPAVLGLIVGLAGPQTFLVVREGRRRAAFLAQLPDTLQVIAGGISAGYSLPQAIDTVVQEASAPMSIEFNRAIVESRLGVPVEDALEGIGERMDSTDFRWVVMAIRIQREVGGNLSEILTTVAETLRDRERIRRQVQVLSAEGRLSAMILGGLPPLFGAYLALVRPEYVEPLYSDGRGIFMSITALLLLGVGLLWLRKVVKVEV